MIRSKYLVGVLLLCILVAFVYKQNPYRIEFLGNYHKIWAHKINSLERLQKASKHFKGIELDLVYDSAKGVLDISHPPAPLSGLSFLEYAKLLPKDPSFGIWLDIKNLNASNASEILNLVTIALKKTSIQTHQIIIESRYPEGLPLFTNAGYSISYYLPYNISEEKTATKEAHIKNIKSIILAQPTIAISSSYKDYNFMKTHFPNTTKYLWMIDGIGAHGFQASEILKDPTVAILLVKFKG